MKNIKKLICLLIIGTLLVTMASPVLAVDVATQKTNPEGEIGLGEFTDGIEGLYEEYDKNKNYIPGKPGEETEYEYQTGRIVVKTDRKIEDGNALEIVGPYHDIYVLQYADAETAESAEMYYEEQDYVDFVQPDRVFQAETDTQTTNSDVSLLAASSLDWAPDICKFSEMQEVLLEKYGSEEKIPQVVVADIDTGITTHTSFENRVLDSGKSFVGDETSVSDLSGHGTATAGCIVLSTLSNVKILPIRLFYGEEQSYTSTGVYDCVEYAVEQKADIINMSYGAGVADPLEKEAIADAAKAGIILVAAYGNDGRETASKYPACYDNVIGVSAIDSSLNIASFSNYGTKVDLSAPGDKIYTVSWTGGYTILSGTSFSSPYVAAGAALIKSYNPKLSESQVIHILYDNAVDCGSKGWDKYYGNGVLCFANIADYFSDSANDVYTHEILKVSFVSNGGSAVSAKNITYGKTVAKPTSTRNGYHLLGWYTDKNLTKAYNFSSKVTANLTLYAKWQKHIYSEKKMVTKAASYTAAGYKKYTCTVCGGGTTTVKISRLKLKATSKFSAKRAKKGVKLTWKKVTGATGYYIYRKTSGGKWKQIKKIGKNKTTTYKDTTAKNKKAYTYRICAYNKVQKSAYKNAKVAKK